MIYPKIPTSLIVCNVVLFAFVVLFLLVLAYFIISSIADVRFFKKNNPTEGVVSAYSFRHGSYFIELEWQNDGKKYCLLYEIPALDYKKYEVGETVKVEEDWQHCTYFKM